MRAAKILVLVAAGCGGGGGGSGPDARPIDASAGPDADWGPPPECNNQFPALDLERVLPTSFARPTAVTASRDDASRLYVVEQAGLIRVIRDGALLAEPFLDLTGTEAEYENGVFSIAFAPDYAESGRFWVSRTPDRTTVVVVEEYRRSAANADRADPTVVRTIARTAAGDSASHNGGQLAFGPDGRLYLSAGDGRSGDSQDMSFMRGKVFRIDVDAPGTDAVDLADAIWHKGLRNPWRFSFDRASGAMYIGDVGAGQEEIDVAAPGASGLDFGWPTMDGDTCAVAGCDSSGMTPPAARPAAGVIIGGYVYRGPAIECLRGWYVYTDYASGRFGRLHIANGTAVDHEEIDGLTIADLTEPSSMGEDAAGELYIVDNTSGGLFKIVAAP
jgi:glucose/arabinose dehydrogenase